MHYSVAQYSQNEGQGIETEAALRAAASDMKGHHKVHLTGQRLGGDATDRGVHITSSRRRQNGRAHYRAVGAALADNYARLIRGATVGVGEADVRRARDRSYMWVGQDRTRADSVHRNDVCDLRMVLAARALCNAEETEGRVGSWQ
jgi:hypothetical protein